MKDVIESWNVIHNFKYNYELVNYVNNRTKIIIICPTHGKFTQIPKNHNKGHGCSNCAIEKKKKKLSLSCDNFIQRSKHTHNNFYNYDSVNYKNNKVKITVCCPIHGNFLIQPSHHLNGIGCSKCANNYNRSTSEFIIDCKKIHGLIYDYATTKFINTTSQVEVLCPSHGIFTQMAGHHLIGHGCPQCKQSKGEKYISDFLKSKNIKFKVEQTFDDCCSIKNSKLRFDFSKFADGIQHFKPIKFFGGITGLESVKKMIKLKMNIV